MATTYDRPTITLQSYAKTPSYTKHGASDDRLAILVCRIKTWKPNGRNWFDIPVGDNCLIIRECESIEISNSYKELISKAVLKFPRGTIVEKRQKADAMVPVDSGQNDGNARSVIFKDATSNGDFLEYYMQRLQTKGTTSKIRANGGIVSMDGTQVDVGLTQINQHLNEKELLNPNDFVVDNRIEIYCGYAYSEDEFKSMMSDTNKVPLNMEMVFTGFITGCSVSTPLEVQCENMAHILTTINVPDITEKNTMKISDFLSDTGKYHLLKDTGISLAKDIGNSTIEVAKFHISNQLTVADVLSEWAKCGIMSYMENNSDGTASLRVGRIYYTGKGGGDLPTKDNNYITYNSVSRYNIIQFDWDVASDNLNLVNNDKKYLAVKATARNKEGKFFGFTIRKTDSSTGDWVTSNNDDTWTIVNEKKIVPKKARVKKDGTLSKQPKGTTTKSQNKTDLSNFNVVSYISTTYPCDRDTLIKEAKQYWNKYVPNGISGSISIFGDIEVKPSDIVGLIDPRQPQKNGYYLVESVNITFGTNGYRKELKMPYKIASFSDYPVYQI